MSCSKCPYGEDWEIPEEDKEIYGKYIDELTRYVNDHGGLEELMMSINPNIVAEGKEFGVWKL